MAAAHPAAFSVNETCRYIGVSRVTLYKILNSGEIPHAKVYGRTLIRRADADDFLERSMKPLLSGFSRRRAKTDIFG